jgi:hypothetical protein
MSDAVRGIGGTIRLVFLRGARKWERLSWLNKYIKNAPTVGTEE